MPAYDTSVPALTLKIGSYPVHHGGLAATRSLGRVSIPVYGIHEDRFTPAGCSRYTAGRFVMPTDAPGGQDGRQGQHMLDGLLTIAEQLGRPAVLVPTDDHAALFVADHAVALDGAFLFPALPAGLAWEVADKARLQDWCVAAGVPVPDSTVVATADELRAYAETADLPVVVKHTAPRLLPGGRRVRTRVVHEREDLRRVDMSAPVLVQEHIPDETSEDWLFHAYCDATSECVVAFTGRKVRAQPPGAGATSLGRSIANPVLEEQARSLLSRLGYRGPVSLDVRLDRRDGQYKLLDVNPRIGAIFRLFVTDLGIDVVRAMHLHLTGRLRTVGRPVDGRVVVVEGYDLRSCGHQVRDRSLTVAAALRSWREVSETAWWAWDDPLPPLVAVGRVAWRAGSRRWRGWRRWW